MTLSRLGFAAAGVVALAMLLSGCSSRSQTPLPVAQAVARGGSWIEAGVAGHDLLYASNANGIVNVYRYWQQTLVGELTDFTQPKGECTDANSDVYITDYGADAVVEYAHGGNAPLRTIDTTPYKPYACAIDPKTGDLAVANYSNASYYSDGNVAVYAHAKGKPAYYSSSDLQHPNGLGYDNYGDLLVTGFMLYGSSSYTYTYFGYLPAKSKTFKVMDLPPPESSGWPYVDGIAWDGKYWVVDAYGTLYQYSINIKAELVGTVELNGRGSDGPVAFYYPNPKKQATQVVTTYGSENSSEVDYYDYPAGGSPIHEITHGLDKPFGVAISVRK
jgi:hypothetical protein